MNDLFQTTCKCCGQPLPEQAPESPFDAFWASIPKGKKKGSKQAASKAWGKLSNADRTLAQERLPVYQGLTKEERIGAAETHISTYLNERRFCEEAVELKMSRYSSPERVIDPVNVAAENIKSGKRFLCTHITGTTAREAIERGLVTKEECDLVGVSV